MPRIEQAPQKVAVTKASKLSTGVVTMSALLSLSTIDLPCIFLSFPSPEIIITRNGSYCIHKQQTRYLDINRDCFIAVRGGRPTYCKTICQRLPVRFARESMNTPSDQYPGIYQTKTGYDLARIYNPSFPSGLPSRHATASCCM